MNVNINLQSLCIEPEKMRGIPCYVKNLVMALSNIEDVKLTATFYDYKGEKNNLRYIEKYLEPVIGKIHINECRNLDWRKEISFWMANTEGEENFKTINYERDINSHDDVYLLPHAATIPRGIPTDKTVITVHDIIPCIDSQYQKYFPEIACRFQNVISYISKHNEIRLITPSHSTKEDLINYIDINSERISAVHSGVDCNQLWNEQDKRVLEELGIKAPFLLYLGAMDPRKGIDIICQAFSIIKDKDISLVLAGGAEKGFDINSVLKNSECKNRIIQTGYVSDHQKRVLMSMSEMFVFPSRYEGFGLPVLEAMACGTPVITSNNSSLPEVGGDACLYIETGDYEGLAQHIDYLLNDKNKRNELIKKGYNRVKLFTWEKTAKNYTDVMKQIVEV